MLRLFREMFMLGLGGLSLVYLLNPLAGVDFLPDVLLVVGNLDEATAAMILFAVLRHYGLDLTRFFQRDAQPRPGAVPPPYTQGQGYPPPYNQQTPPPPPYPQQNYTDQPPQR